MGPSFGEHDGPGRRAITVLSKKEESGKKPSTYYCLTFLGLAIIIVVLFVCGNRFVQKPFLSAAPSVSGFQFRGLHG